MKVMCFQQSNGPFTPVAFIQFFPGAPFHFLSHLFIMIKELVRTKVVKVGITNDLLSQIVGVLRYAGSKDTTPDGFNCFLINILVFQVLFSLIRPAKFMVNRPTIIIPGIVEPGGGSAPPGRPR